MRADGFGDVSCSHVWRVFRHSQVGPLQTAPILVAVVTSFLAYEGVKGIVPIGRATPTADAPPPVGPPGTNDPN
jgi:hypothetical protein